MLSQTHSWSRLSVVLVLRFLHHDLHLTSHLTSTDKTQYNQLGNLNVSPFNCIQLSENQPEWHPEEIWGRDHASQPSSATSY